MTTCMKRAVIRLIAETLILPEKSEEYTEMLKRFDETFGASIPDWPDRIKEMLASFDCKTVPDAIAAVDAYCAGCKVSKGEDIPYQLRITFDRSAPAGQRLTIDKCPDPEQMSLAELQAYHDELQSALDDLEESEPEELDSEEYDNWEDECSELEDLIEDVAERLGKTGVDPDPLDFRNIAEDAQTRKILHILQHSSDLSEATEKVRALLDK